MKALSWVDDDKQMKEKSERDSMTGTEEEESLEGTKD